MKNIKISETPSRFFRVPLHGAPPLRGWAVRYISGMEEMNDEVKPGYWLSQWVPIYSSEEVSFRFEPTLHMCFTEEAVAQDVSRHLREVGEIQTEVLKVG